MLTRLTKTMPVIILAAGMGFYLSQSVLAEEAIELEKVVVTATKGERVLKDVPVRTEVITSKEIEAKNIKTVQEALKYLTGVKINKSCCSWGDKGKIELQGLDEKHTLILVDGQRILGGHRNAVDLQQISIEMVERIEVVKGPASALYGSDAVGGVVNIITKSAPLKPIFSTSASFGAHGTQIHEVSGGFKKDRFGGFLNYTYRESEGVSKETDQYWESIFQGSFQYEFTQESKLTLKPYYSEQRMKYEGRKQERFGLNSIWEWATDELSKLSLRGSLFNYKHLTADKKSDWDNDNYEVELNYSRLLFDKYTLTGGYQLLKEDEDDRGKKYKADQTINSFFIQDEMNFAPFTFVLGTRLDKHDKWGREVNPKASLLYKVIDDLKLRASVGTGFKAPPLVRLYADGWRMGPYLVHANPDLKPEDSIGYQVGAEYKFSEKLLTELSLFRNELKNLMSYRIVKKPSPPPYDMYWENVDKARTQGIELNLTSQLVENLTTKLGYTFLDTKDESTGKELTYKPKHKLSLELGYEIPKIELSINLEGEYIGRRYDSNYNRLEGYTIFNLALTKDIGKHAQVFARVDNIFGKKNISDEYDIDGTEFMGGLKVKLGGVK
ncbi:MAG: TonB-dependent receptor [bacterium]